MKVSDFRRLPSIPRLDSWVLTLQMPDILKCLAASPTHQRSKDQASDTSPCASRLKFKASAHISQCSASEILLSRGLRDSLFTGKSRTSHKFVLTTATSTSFAASIDRITRVYMIN